MRLASRPLRTCAFTTALLWLSGCGGNPEVTSTPDVPDSLALTARGVTVTLTLQPHFGMTVSKLDGSVALQTLGEGRTVADDALGAYTAIGASHRDTSLDVTLLEGYDHAIATDGKWFRATTVTSATSDGSTAHVVLKDADEPSVRIAFDLRLQGSTVDVEVTPVTDRADAAQRLNLFGQAFAIAPGEKFVGLGEREDSLLRNGKRYGSWVEEGGLGAGESAAPGPQNPFPNGPSMTHAPIPFFISSNGYGVFVRTSVRTAYSFGNDDPEAFRFEAEEPALRYRIYVHDLPSDTLADYTADTGRAQLPAPWVFGPRRRMDFRKTVNGVLEAQLLRDRGVATTVSDDTTHFLPNNASLGREAELREWTAELHRLGFKAMGYFNGHVSATKPEAADLLADGRARDIFVRLDDGSESQVRINSAGWQNVVTLDFTNPAATTWFEGKMGEALALGYDGWMLDFGEYLPQRALLSNGLTGYKAHNLFPLMLQKAATDYLRKQRGNDFLYYARSGYAGTQGYAPVLWSGDPPASFDDARGLPAQVRAGINAGLSGIPFWGSNISGFTCATDDLPDKEMYLRWTEFGALSSDMHDDNACAGRKPGNPDKWTLWSDDETVEVYGRYARLHTQLFPYLYAAAAEAVATGLPVMRHPLLMQPASPEAWEAEHEFWFGKSLFVAPVVRRGETTREFWLPHGTWFDWWTFEALEGGKRVARDAPLDSLPLFLRAGSIIPMLPPDVQTLAVTDDPSVVDASDHPYLYDVRAALSPDDKTAHITLVNGARFAAELIEGDITAPATVEVLPDGTRKVTVEDEGIIHAGALTVSGLADEWLPHARWTVLVR